MRVLYEVFAEVFYAVRSQFETAVGTAYDTPVCIEEILIRVRLRIKRRFAVILQRIAAISPDIEVIRPVPAIFLQIFPYGLMYMIGRIDILLGTVNRKQGQYCYTGEQRNERFFAFECKEVKSE